MHKFFGNWLDDSVIREDENGNRYIKRFTPGKIPVEVAVSTDCIAAFGGHGYGEVHELREISRKDYERFGIAWEWGSTAWGKKIHIDYKEEHSDIPSLVRHGVFIELVRERDEEDFIKYLQRIYAGVNSNRTAEGKIKPHFEDPTDLKEDTNGQIIVPLNLEGLRGLYKQYNKYRKLKYIQEIEEEYPGITSTLDLLYNEGYLTSTYSKQSNTTTAELKLIGHLIMAEQSREIQWKVFESIFEIAHIGNVDLLRASEKKQKAIYKLFPSLVVEKVKNELTKC